LFWRKEKTLDKTTFIHTLQKARAEWEALLAHMDEQRMLQPGNANMWSVKEIIVHVNWYEREMVPIMRTHIFTGSDLWEKETDERNTFLTQQNRNRPWEEIIKEEQHTYTELLEAAQELSDEDLNDAHRFKEMPEDWVPWQVFASNSFQHYQDHFPDLHQWLTHTEESGQNTTFSDPP
jgi:hypothetical protein